MRLILRSALCFSVFFLCLAGTTFRAQHACAAGESASCNFVLDALTASTNLKVGMLRSDIEKDFVVDGGMEFRDRATYTFRRCHYIKIDIEFKTHENSQNTYPYPPDDEISKVSKPYLSYPVSD